jgi:hypothetical protein
VPFEHRPIASREAEREDRADVVGVETAGGRDEFGHPDRGQAFDYHLVSRQSAVEFDRAEPGLDLSQSLHVRRHGDLQVGSA